MAAPFDPSHGGEVAFFGIAATLIPILVFSGVVAERHGPQPQDSHTRTLVYAFLIPVFGSAAILGELMSIGAVIVGHGSGFMVGFVAVVLTMGLVGVVLMVWLPWLSAFKKRIPTLYRSVFWTSCVMLVVVGAATVFLIVDAVDSVGEVERIESSVLYFEHENDAVRDELNRNLQEHDRLKVQLQVDARASAQARERLIQALAERAPTAVIKSLELRVDQEFELMRLDAARAVQLDKEAGRLFKKQDRLYRELLEAL